MLFKAAFMDRPFLSLACNLVRGYLARDPVLTELQSRVSVIGGGGTMVRMVLSFALSLPRFGQTFCVCPVHHCLENSSPTDAALTPCPTCTKHGSASEGTNLNKTGPVELTSKWGRANSAQTG